MTDSIFTIRRAFLACATATLALGLAVGTAQSADKFPSKTIEVVTHAGAGGGTDVTSRMALLRGRRVLGVDMVIVNKRGGNGAVSMNYANQQERDGYTIMLITPSHLMTIIQGKSVLKFEDLVGLARATDEPQWLISKKGRFANAAAMVAEGKKKALKIGGTHVGSIDHVAIATFAKKSGIKYKYIPYEGGGAIITNLIGGDLDIGILNLSEAESQIQAGEVDPTLVLRKERMAAFPQYEAAGDLGIEAYFSTIRGFVTLKGAPADRLATLEKGLVKAMNHSLYVGYLEQIGLDKTSIVGAAEWNAQIKSIYNDSVTALTELGFIKKK